MNLPVGFLSGTARAVRPPHRKQNEFAGRLAPNAVVFLSGTARAVRPPHRKQNEFAGRLAPFR
ncbi:hypothetical protein FF011L_48370 [Roseimaritima multifibrata]|uniref:Uncharacterized protein n=1 Tax=Roseimaritima multifibrata TaxID=1930274 RepID=A0A517MMB2_9BACT|nr:hypothetical protein FF011L_48370 [Roseimaritima multifibrata]